jgi:hypothetical protein
MRVAEAWSAGHSTSVHLRLSDERNTVSKYQSIKVSKYKSTKCRILEAFLSAHCIYYRLSLFPHIYRTEFASRPR